MFIVCNGSLDQGYQFIGPFETAEAATDFLVRKVEIGFPMEIHTLISPTTWEGN